MLGKCVATFTRSSTNFPLAIIRDRVNVDRPQLMVGRPEVMDIGFSSGNVFAAAARFDRSIDAPRGGGIVVSPGGPRSVRTPPVSRSCKRLGEPSCMGATHRMPGPDIGALHPL